jgi:hypothetical protein
VSFELSQAVPGKSADCLRISNEIVPVDEINMSSKGTLDQEQIYVDSVKKTNTFRGCTEFELYTASKFIFPKSDSIFPEQNRALLDTLCLHQSNSNWGHIVLYSTLVIGHTKHPGHMYVSSWPCVPKKLQQTNRQDMVFIRPPGLSDGVFQLRIDNVWFFKLFLLFKIDTKTDAGMKKLDSASLSVLEECNGY